MESVVHTSCENGVSQSRAFVSARGPNKKRGSGHVFPGGHCRGNLRVGKAQDGLERTCDELEGLGNAVVVGHVGRVWLRKSHGDRGGFNWGGGRRRRGKTSGAGWLTVVVVRNGQSSGEVR